MAPAPAFDVPGAAIADQFPAQDPTVQVSDLESPVYNYSVVPGGVRSADEVARVVSRDPVVAAHYSDVDVSLLRRERLRTTTVAHVSYRMDDKVYFTSKPVRIEAGEAVLTDGQKTIRERCGNVISVEPIGPTAANEPPVEQLDRVIAPVGPPAQRSASAATPAGPIPSSNPPGGTPFSITPPGTPPGGGAPPGGVPPTYWTPSFPLPPGTTPVVPPGGDPPPGPTPTPTPPGPTPTPPGPTPTPPPDVPPPPPPPDVPPPPPYDPPPYDPPLDPPLPVPEPSTFVLVGIGAAAGLVKLLKQRRAPKQD